MQTEAPSEIYQDMRTFISSARMFFAWVPSIYLYLHNEAMYAYEGHFLGAPTTVLEKLALT